MSPRLLLLFLFIFISFSSLAQSKVWTLKECIDYALSNNIRLKKTEASNEFNRINLSQSRANRVPALNATGSQGFSFGRSIDPFTNQYVNQTIRTNNFSLSSNLILFNGLQNANTIRRNEIDYESGKLDVETVKNGVLLDVIYAYLQTLFGYEQVDNTVTQMVSTKAQLERTEKLVKAGSLPEINLLKIKSQLSSENLALVTAENNLRTSKIILMQIMEYPVTDNFEIEKITVSDSLIQNMIAESSTDIYNSALTTQPQVKSYGLKTQSALMNIKISEGARLPRLILNGNLYSGYSSARELTSIQTSIQQQDVGFLKSNPAEIVSAFVPVTSRTTSAYGFGRQLNDNFGQSVSLGLSIPIINNRLVRSNIERAQVNLLISQLNEREVKNQLRKSIEQSYADMRAAERKFVAAQENLQLQEQTFNNSRIRYEIGAGNSTDFLVDKNNYTRAQSDFIQAKYEYLFRLKVLDFYKGQEMKFN
ncbi:MAG: TolC family protein [Cytophagaceae bacterium]|nr:TolC family protein [Cytophagaceae bacterium]